MSEQLFNDAWYVKCPACGVECNDVDIIRYLGGIVGCVFCYVTDACPDQCGEPHPAPPTHRCGVDEWTCPTTERVFHWCVACREWTDDRYGDGAVVYGDWLCSPYEHGYYRCDGCERWSYSDEMRWDEYGDSCYCESCYRDNVEGVDEPAVCDRCRVHPPTHIHDSTEDGLCDRCAANEPLAYAVAA